MDLSLNTTIANGTGIKLHLSDLPLGSNPFLCVLHKNIRKDRVNRLVQVHVGSKYNQIWFTPSKRCWDWTPNFRYYSVNGNVFFTFTHIRSIVNVL